MKRWVALAAAAAARFEFVTNGRLGPTGDLVRDAFEQAQAASTEQLAQLLEVDPASSICERLRGAFVGKDTAAPGVTLDRGISEQIAAVPGFMGCEHVV